MNRSHRLSQGAKKVTPPSIPSFSNPRGSGSSFGSDLSYSEREDSNVSNHPMSTFSRAPNGESSSSSPGKKKWYFVTKIVLTYCEKKTFCKFSAFSLEFQKLFSITRTIFSHSTSVGHNNCWILNSSA